MLRDTLTSKKAPSLDSVTDTPLPDELDMIAIDATVARLLRQAASDFDGTSTSVVNVMRRLRDDAGDLDAFTQAATLLVNCLVIRGGELLRTLSEVTGQPPEELTSQP